jgi:hypothetical protein
MSGVSSGGIFKLISNNEVHDKLLIATEYLSNRIKIISSKTKERNSTNDSTYLNLDTSWLSDINSISKSHTIFTHGSFKPFAAAGFEYNKVASQGVVRYGTDVIFDIPTFGDYINDCVIHIKLSKLKTIDPRDRVRYVAMLGHKIFKKLLFKVNNNPLDMYYTDDYNLFYEFQVPPEKRVGWLRNMGQQIPHEALITADPEYDFHSEIKYFTDGNQTFKQEHDEVHLWIPLLFWFKDIHNSLPNSAIPFGQTKIVASITEISDLVGYCDYGGGGGYIPPEIELMELYMNNIFMNPDVINLIMSKFGFSLIRVHCRHSELLSNSDDSIRLNYLKWPTESLYVMFKPKNNSNYSQHWNKSSLLVPCDVQVPVVARSHSNTISCIVDKSLDYIITNSFVVLQIDPNTNNIITFMDDIDYNEYTILITGGTGYIPNNKKKNTYTIINEKNNNFVLYDTSGRIYDPLNPPTDGAVFDDNLLGVNIKGVWNSDYNPDETTTFILYTLELGINTSTYYKELPVIESMEIVAHGITLFRNTNESFYNSYLPYRFGSNINTPRDRGMYMINFNFNPGNYQPSGHVNLSRAREFYIKYQSLYNLASPEYKTELIVSSTAINFLLVKNGSAFLRYST